MGPLFAPVCKSQSPHYDCPYEMPSMTPGEGHNEWYQYYCSNIYLFNSIKPEFMLNGLCHLYQLD